MISPKAGRTAAIKLKAFLASADRPIKTLNFNELKGFLFAIACTPEIVSPSDWLPLVFNESDANYRNLDEANAILNTIIVLFNKINSDVLNGKPHLPRSCKVFSQPQENLESSAPLSQWSRGFFRGHDNYVKLWSQSVPKTFDNELGSSFMILSFFADFRLAEAYQRAFANKKYSLDELAESMIELFPLAMSRYARLGRIIYLESLEKNNKNMEFNNLINIDKNEPCPCGSGKSFKKCCLH